MIEIKKAPDENKMPAMIVFICSRAPSNPALFYEQLPALHGTICFKGALVGLLRRLACVPMASCAQYFAPRYFTACLKFPFQNIAIYNSPRTIIHC
ncbi:MAG: hypothetical protein PHW41_08905 [Eubacteriales bacterium]|nr:hypothetical protein [Eubacteriales bacterium]